MYIVSPQYVGMNPATGLAGALSEPVQIDRVIPVGEEAGLAIVPVLDNVQGNIR